MPIFPFLMVEKDHNATVDLVMRESETQVQVIGSFDSESLFRPVGDHDQMQSILQACGRGYFVVGVLSADRNLPTLLKRYAHWARILRMGT